MTQRSRLGMVALAFTILGAACGGEAEAPSGTPSSAFPEETAPPLTGATGIELPLDPADGTGNLNSGSVSFQIAGDVELETTLRTLITGISVPPPAGFAIVWSDEGTDATTLGIGGGSFVGTRPTSTALTLTIAAQSDAGLSTWISSAGECQITIDAAGTDRIAGSFTCDDLRSSEGREIDASGRFEATE